MEYIIKESGGMKTIIEADKVIAPGLFDSAYKFYKNDELVFMIKSLFVISILAYPKITEAEE